MRRDGLAFDIDAAAPPELVTHPPDHFLVMLDLAFRYDGGVVRGSAPVRPTLCAAGTRVLRPSLLLTMIDFMSGDVTGRKAGPTLDMRLQVLQPPPTSGRIHIVVRPLRIGVCIVVSEATLSDDGGTPFARGLTTFMNNHYDGLPEHPRPGEMVEPTFDEMIATNVRDECTLEFAPNRRHLNGFGIGTVQGGVQSLLAELCAQHALGGGEPMVASDIDVRFLSALREFPMVATAEPLPSADGGARCRVAITNSTGDRVVTYVALTMVPAS